MAADATPFCQLQKATESSRSHHRLPRPCVKRWRPRSSGRWHKPGTSPRNLGAQKKPVLWQAEPRLNMAGLTAMFLAWSSLVSLLLQTCLKMTGMAVLPVLVAHPKRPGNPKPRWSMYSKPPAEPIGFVTDMYHISLNNWKNPHELPTSPFHTISRSEESSSRFRFLR